MKLFRMKLPTDSTHPDSVGIEDGSAHNPVAAVLDIPARDPFLYWAPRWCANCGGEQTFVPVDRFQFGWRGYCLGCEETKYVMDTRTNSEVA